MMLRLFLLSLFLLSLAGCVTLHKNDLERVLPGSVYVVKQGDNLKQIAKKYNVAIDDLMETNGILDVGSLRVGQYLFIPESLPTPKTSSSKTAEKPAWIKDDDGKTIALDWPIKDGVLFRSFDQNPARLYEGVALGAPMGTPVRAAASGEVIYVGDNGTHYGLMVIIRHADPFVTVYAHLNEINVPRGKVIKKGELIGTVGTSGGIDSPRVYFQVRKNRMPVDPERYLVQLAH